MRLLLMITLLSAPLFACCVFDYDFLEDELRAWPNVLEIIAGRIERQPATYHEARLQKALRNQLPGGHVQNLMEAARACDQLNRQEEGIALLQPLLDEQSSDADRTAVHSLLVQLHAHLWWLGGTASTPAARCIEEARKYNAGLPNGQFMDKFLQWAERQEPADPEGLLSDFFELRLANKTYIAKNTQLRELGLQGVQSSLLALIQLHPVWENFDTFYALSMAWAVDGFQPLGHFARLRAWELHEQGRKSRLPGIDTITDIRGVTVVRDAPPRSDFKTSVPRKEQLPLDKVYEQRIAECFKGYRDYAKRWLAAREDYLRTAPTGYDPDDAAVWDGFMPALGSLPPLPRPDVQPAAAVEAEKPAEQPAGEAAGPEPQGRNLTPWLLIGGLLVLLSLGFVTHRAISRKEPEPTP